MLEGHVHYLGSERTHTRWRPDLEPVLTVDPGDTVVMTCRDGFDGQVDPPVSAGDLEGRTYSCIDFGRVAPLTGPVAVRGAKPGDTLEVRLLDIVPFGTGTIVIFPSWMESDFLPSEHRNVFPKAWMKSFDMARAVEEGWVELREGVRVPLRPMVGMMGTAPASGDYGTGQPREFGANMDVKDVAKGSILYLPVFQQGALFSAGDAHAVQGDGEMCTTTIETGATLTVQFHLHAGRHIPGPQIETPEEFMTIAYGKDLDQAAQRAMAYMIEYLVARQGLDSHEAYALLSLACDLKVNQVVNFPHLGARVSLSKKVFASWRW